MRFPEDLEKPRQMMWEEVADKIGEGALEEEVLATVRNQISTLYDNRDELRVTGGMEDGREMGQTVPRE